MANEREALQLVLNAAVQVWADDTRNTELRNAIELIAGLQAVKDAAEAASLAHTFTRVWP